MARTQEERKAETRSRLLDAAAEMFARRGFDAVSAEAVCDAAGRTTGSLYSHFGGKEGLLVALVDEWSGAAGAAVSSDVDADAPVSERLASLWHNFTATDGDIDPWILLEHDLWLRAVRGGPVRPVVEDRYATGRAGLGRMANGWAHEEGADTGLRARHMGALVLALLLGLEMQRRLDPACVPDDLAVEGLQRLLKIARDE